MMQPDLNNYDSLSIRKLPDTVKKNGFVYKLINRTNERCIYAQLSSYGNICAYEFFLTKLGDLRKAKQRFAKLENKEFNSEDYEEYYEIFPSDEEFGERAWTYPNLEFAQKAFDSKKINV